MQPKVAVNGERLMVIGQLNCRLKCLQHGESCGAAVKEALLRLKQPKVAVIKLR